MNDFVVAWRSIWLPFLGGDGTFSIFFNGSSVWSMNYVDVTAYVLWVVMVLWLASLSVRILRKIICGVFD